MLLLKRLAAFCLFLVAAAPALAHPVDAPPARDTHWSWDPLVLTSVAVAAICYLAGFVRLWRRLGSTRLLGQWEIATFTAGLMTILIALVSPIDSIAQQVFWVHMIQHLLLLMVAAPLLVWGRPAIAFLWAFEPAGRKRLGRVWMRLGLRAGLTSLMHPILVWTVFCGAFVFWHFPAPHQWALRDENIHTLEHLSFLVTALMFWSIVIEPSGRRRLAYGPTVVFVATAAILSGLPGALIALAPRPLYPAYAEGVAAWGMTLLEDQQLAGIVMWIPGGAVYLAAVALVFVKWLQEGDGHRPALLRRAALPAFLVYVLPLLLGGCGDDNSPSSQTADAAHRGARLIGAYGCGSCHSIPGIDNANGVVGPPLTSVGRRIYIAGLLRNTPGNLVAWLRDPQSIVPGNVMPNMGLSERDAQDVAAYLYTLR